MDKLIRGVHRFRKEVFEPNRAMYQQLADGQKPHTLFIACSDSRLSTEALTQTGPGEIFVLRNAGNLVPPHGATLGGGEAATIEFAVAGLGVRHIVVCGHTGCGAMKALLNPESVADLPETERWLRNAEATRLVVNSGRRHSNEHERWLALVQVNVWIQLENLRTHPVVAAGLAHGTLNVHGWVLDLRTGEVSRFDPIANCFVPIEPIEDEEAVAVVAMNGKAKRSKRS